MKPQIKRFLKALNNDENFANRIKSASPKEKEEIFKSHLDGMTINEFKSELAKVQKILASGDKEKISEEDLSSVAGGGIFGKGLGMFLGTVLGGGDENARNMGNVGDGVGDFICQRLKN